MYSNTESSEQKSTVFVTRFESSEDGIKSTTSKIDDIEGVLVEEVLSEPEREKDKPHGDVTIEEIPEEGEICSPNFVHTLTELLCRFTTMLVY